MCTRSHEIQIFRHRYVSKMLLPFLNFSRLGLLRAHHFVAVEETEGIESLFHLVSIVSCGSRVGV